MFVIIALLMKLSIYMIAGTMIVVMLTALIGLTSVAFPLVELAIVGFIIYKIYKKVSSKKKKTEKTEKTE